MGAFNCMHHAVEGAGGMAARQVRARLRPHRIGRISPISSLSFPVFCAFSPPRRGGSNEPQAGTQDRETVARGSELTPAACRRGRTG